MQTRLVVEPVSVDAEEDRTIPELVSVFISPDEALDLSAAEIADRQQREQRLDGVLRFGDELLVVIESKVVGKAATDQAQQLRLRGVEFEQRRAAALGWHELSRTGGGCSSEGW